MSSESFLALPAEIRSMVYEQLFPAKTRLRIRQKFWRVNRLYRGQFKVLPGDGTEIVKVLNILCTSKQIRAEALPVLKRNLRIECFAQNIQVCEDLPINLSSMVDTVYLSLSYAMHISDGVADALSTPNSNLTRAFTAILLSITLVPLGNGTSNAMKRTESVLSELLMEPLQSMSQRFCRKGVKEDESWYIEPRSVRAAREAREADRSPLAVKARRVYGTQSSKNRWVPWRGGRLDRYHAFKLSTDFVKERLAAVSVVRVEQTDDGNMELVEIPHA